MVRAELHGGPLDGTKLELVEARDWVRLMNKHGVVAESDVLTPDDPRVVAVDMIDYEVSCYHRSGRRPLWGRWRYHYHGPA
jgi:hypothetical protein